MATSRVEMKKARAKADEPGCCICGTEACYHVATDELLNLTPIIIGLNKERKFFCEICRTEVYSFYGTDLPSEWRIEAERLRRGRAALRERQFAGAAASQTRGG